MKRLVCLPILLALSSGCTASVINSHSARMTYHTDVAFTASERSCLESSAKQWSDQTSDLAHIQFAYDYEPLKTGNVLEHELSDKLVRWTSKSPEVITYEKEMSSPNEPPWILLGLTSRNIVQSVRLPITVRLVMDRLQDDHKCQLTAIHEFGHAFGLPHDGHRSDIMFPSVDVRRSACLKNNDLVMFSMLNDVPGDLMKPCPTDSVLDQEDLLDVEDTSNVTEAY